MSTGDPSPVADQHDSPPANVVDAIIMAIAMLANTRDLDIGNHMLRKQMYVRALAWKLSTHPRFQATLTVSYIAMLFKAVPLHDIGKVGIPDRILLKPGKLTAEEFDIMKTHVTLGSDTISRAQAWAGEDVPLLTVAKEMAYSHHEKWDGTGYPQGLAGDHIPVSARLMALADVYDALISRRVYKAPLSHAESVNIIAQLKGTHFDADVVDAFLEIEANIHAIAVAYSDTDDDQKKKDVYRRLAQVTC
jgi:putative two-component system response regulator